MHCFLHIGVEKTGTTSIQKFLYLNRALLNQNGYQLTDSLSKPNNTGITVLSLSSLKNEEIKYFSVVSSEQKFNKKKQFLKRSINEEVKKAQRILSIFEDANTGLVMVDGKLIEKPVLRQMQRTVEISNKLKSPQSNG